VSTDTDLLGPDLVLLMLAAPTEVETVRGRVFGITRLEKLLYLADIETKAQDKVSEPLVFQPYHYGPYSKEVYEAVELLERVGLLREERAVGKTLDEMEEIATDATDETRIERRFFLTEEGASVATLLTSQHPDVVQKLATIKDRYGRMSLRQLIRYVYTTYPESAVNSKIRHLI
jgi:uncharacterized protein